jgi:hypothetical protein
MLDELITAVAGGCGFRASDYTATWDGGRYDPSRTSNELVIQTNDVFLYLIFSFHGSCALLADYSGSRD